MELFKESTDTDIVCTYNPFALLFDILALTRANAGMQFLSTTDW